jgi:hypothetical protein
MESHQTPVTAYVLSLIGGIITFLTGIIGLAWFGSNGPNWTGFGGFMGRIMNGYHGMMGGNGSYYSLFSILSIIGIVAGVLVVVSAVMLRIRPKEHVLWGAMIIAFSAISLVGMGGFFIGAILGIIGGSFAIAYKPQASNTSQQQTA